VLEKLVYPLVRQLQQHPQVAPGEVGPHFQYLVGKLPGLFLGLLSGSPTGPYPGDETVERHIAGAEQVVDPARSEQFPYPAIQRVQGAGPA